MLCALSIGGYAQSTCSDAMEKAIDICNQLSTAVGTRSTGSLKSANKAFKAAKLKDFSDIWLSSGEESNLDGHFLFDEEFVDSLIVNRKVLEFSRQYAEKRTDRGSMGGKGHIKLTTKALKAGQTATWRTVNRLDAEYALVAEPKGLFTMTIKDKTGKVLYTETVNNKKGAAVRRAVFTLPDKGTEVYIEIVNRGRKDASFALLSN